MSQTLKSSAGSGGSVSNISKYADELASLIEGNQLPLVHIDDNVEDPTVFALEKHLEEFLVTNWQQTDLSNDYDIFTKGGEKAGQQYPTDTGPVDILAISKDQKTLLVVELKRGRASDVVVGQIQCYMGCVQDELAGKPIKRLEVIIALEDDIKLKRALSVALKKISFYRYQVNFSLYKTT